MQRVNQEMEKTMPDELRVVADPDSMDEDIFIKHVNKSHMPIAGLKKLSPVRQMPGLRAYHARCHELGIEDESDRPVDHTHQGSK
jgi:hypothetical protein